jgi:hypothetical protein
MVERIVAGDFQSNFYRTSQLRSHKSLIVVLSDACRSAAEKLGAITFVFLFFFKEKFLVQ